MFIDSVKTTNTHARKSKEEIATFLASENFSEPANHMST